MNLEGLVVSKIFWILTANLLKRLQHYRYTLSRDNLCIQFFLGSRCNLLPILKVSVHSLEVRHLFWVQESKGSNPFGLKISMEPWSNGISRPC